MGLELADSDISTRKNLYDRVSHLLESYEWSDCTFSVSGKCFKAHKLLLGISSPVFKAMFYGPLSTDKDVVVCDIEPNIFQEVINYIYTDKIDLQSVEQAFELLYASKKYMLEYLAERCKIYIENNISVDNVMVVLNYADYVQEKQLFDQGLALLCAHSEFLVRSSLDSFSLSTLKALLECGQVNIVEKNLIKAVFKWTHHYCIKNDIKPIKENKRQLLIDNGLLQKLRFLALEPYQLDDILAQDNLLLPDEVKFIKDNTDNKTQDSKSEMENMISQVKVPRQTLKFRWYFCHRSALRSASPLKIDEFHNRVHIRMKCDKTVFINSLGVRTKMAPQINYRDDVTCGEYMENFLVTIVKEDDNNLVKSFPYCKEVEHDSTIFVEFDVPCIIQKDEWYRISFHWLCDSDFNVQRYVVCHRNRICNHKATFVFDDMAVHTDINGSFLEALKYTF